MVIPHLLGARSSRFGFLLLFPFLFLTSAALICWTPVVTAGGARSQDVPKTRSQERSRKRPAKPAPTHANVPYGTHERNVLDFWQAESRGPAPLVVYIHGGGFNNGSKESLNSGTLKELLEAGISVAAIHYRLIPDKPLPAAHLDSRRALQFLRSRAGEWNIDKKRVGAFGGSAGAQLCMWLAFHDDMADPDSPVPLEQESTRLVCVATSGGQITRDLDWWEKNIPGYQKHRDPYQTFGVKTEEELRKGIKETSPITHITADDPPIFMSYKMAPDDPIPTDSGQVRGWQVHHVIFGVTLKKKMDALGIKTDLKYPGSKTVHDSMVHFFKVHLGNS